MKRKLTIIFVIFAILALSSAVWQAYEAATLEDKLQEIDRTVQTKRLLEESIPNVNAKLTRLINDERAKMGTYVKLDTNYLPPPLGGRADFNQGFFVYSLDGRLLMEQGNDALKKAVQASNYIPNTIRLRINNPSAPVQAAVGKPGSYNPKAVPHANTVIITDNPEEEADRVPGRFNAFVINNCAVYMRTLHTPAGDVAQGFIIDTDILSKHLLDEVSPGLLHPEIGAPVPSKKEQPNLEKLPLILRPGNEVDMPDTSQRAAAMRGTVFSAWLTSGLSILVLFGLLTLYARVERRRSDFVSAVTHELRTPLTTFNLYTEMLCKDGLPEEKVKEYHETLYNESRRLGHLVENVLSFARLSRGKIRGRMDRGTCGELLPKLISPMAERLSKAGFTVTDTIDPKLKLITLRTDLSSVEQILRNLTDNALKYVEGPAPSMSISAIQSHRSIILRFKDNGPGIPPELKSKLFQAFSRSAQAEKGRKPGVGLGLALSRDLARSIGGELALEKSDDKGSTFTLTLPLGE